MRFSFHRKASPQEALGNLLPWHKPKARFSKSAYLSLILVLCALALSLLFLKSLTETRRQAAPAPTQSRRIMLELVKDSQGNIKVNRAIADPLAPPTKRSESAKPDTPRLIHNGQQHLLDFTPTQLGEDFAQLGLPTAQGKTHARVTPPTQTAYITLDYTPNHPLSISTPNTKPKNLDTNELNRFIPSLNQPTILGSTTPNPTLDILFISDKYTNSNKFLADAQTIFNYIVSLKPFSNHQDHIRLVTLYLPQGLGCFRHPDNQSLIICDVLKIYDAARGQAYDEIIVLEDSNLYGGSGLYPHIATTYSDTNSWAKEVAAHEFGHSFGGLGDEYDLGYTYTDSNSPLWPNCDLAACSKWLPHATAGCFATCGATNLYRPTFSGSLMRTLTPEGGAQYGPVSEEAMLKNLLGYITLTQDINRDFVLDWRDLLALIPNYDTVTTCSSLIDLNGDCLISLFDFSALTSAFEH